jgi:hypothetical protein
MYIPTSAVRNVERQLVSGSGKDKTWQNQHNTNKESLDHLHQQIDVSNQ